jgi:hypothetical protein
MSSMDIHTIRRNNLQYAIDLYFGGVAVQLAKAVKPDNDSYPSYINNIRSGIKPMGEKSARLIEKRLALAVGWMDAGRDGRETLPPQPLDDRQRRLLDFFSEMTDEQQLESLKSAEDVVMRNRKIAEMYRRLPPRLTQPAAPMAGGDSENCDRQSGKPCALATQGIHLADCDIACAKLQFNEADKSAGMTDEHRRVLREVFKITPHSGGDDFAIEEKP